VWNNTAAVHPQKPRPRLFPMDNGVGMRRSALACAFGLVNSGGYLKIKR
jgi:hypothetical protein